MLQCLGGIDYDSGPYDVKFPAGETRSSFNIPIKFDTLVEGDEEFHLTVATTSLVYGFNLGHPSTVKVDIMDSKYSLCYVHITDLNRTYMAQTGENLNVYCALYVQKMHLNAQ